MSAPLLEFRAVAKSYPAPGGKRCVAVENATFRVNSGEAVGLVGPSGSGKSTVARLSLGLEKPDAGDVLFMGENVAGFSKKRQREHFRQVQMVWQDPFVYLNPFQSVLTSIVEPMAAFGIGDKSLRREKALEWMRKMKLPEDLAARKPSRLSGGQCQRVAIARALSVSPKLLVCDEALVNLDLPRQVAMLELLEKLRTELRLAILFVSHDRDTVRALCGRTLTMKAGAVRDVRGWVY